MTNYVADASVAVKWMLPEEYEANAHSLLARGVTLHGPAHMRAEIANAMWKRVRRSLLTSAEAVRGLSLGERVPVVQHPVGALLPVAFDLAVRYDRTVYDALYVALALREGCQFVTADRRLYNSLAEALPQTMLWIEDVPGDG